MPVYVAFLRGINVGRNNQVSMADLKRVVEGVGHADVRTHLRSGNVVFGAKAGDEAKLEAALERALDTELGLPVRVVVRSAKALDAVIAANPFPDALDAPSNLHVVFLDREPDPAFVRAFDHEAIAPDAVRFAGREIYVWYRHGMAGSTHRRHRVAQGRGDRDRPQLEHRDQARRDGRGGLIGRSGRAGR